MDFTGYDYTLEERLKLCESALKFDIGALTTASDVPDKFDPSPWLRIENQGRVGRCAGMAACLVGEMCHYLQTGKVIQFNGHYSYIRAQQKSRGLYGRDSGSTITGNITAAKEHGFCPIDWDNDGVDDYPLPPNYTTNIPARADQEAANFKIKHHVMLEDGFDAILHFLQLGLGAAFAGGPWGNWRPDRATGLVTTFVDGGGGHAWGITGWDLTRTMFPEDVLIMDNSHSTNWGKGGRAYLAKSFVNRFVKHRFVSVAGMTDLTTIARREINWSEEWLLG